MMQALNKDSTKIEIVQRAIYYAGNTVYIGDRIPKTPKECVDTIKHVGFSEFVVSTFNWYKTLEDSFDPLFWYKVYQDSEKKGRLWK